MRKANYRAALDAGQTALFRIGRHQPGASEHGRWTARHSHDRQ
jgi:hypothetical protein